MSKDEVMSSDHVSETKQRAPRMKNAIWFSMGHDDFGGVPGFFGRRSCPMENQMIFHRKTELEPGPINPLLPYRELLNDGTGSRARSR